MKLLNTLMITALVGVGLTGCRNTVVQTEEHEEHALKLTAYGPHLELFAELSPMVRGEESELLCHLTKLDNYKPLEAASLTTQLSVDGQVLNVPAGEAERPGIYHLRFTPQKVGGASLCVVVKADDYSDTLRVEALRVFDNEEAAHEDAERREISSATAVTFNKELSWAIDFSTAVVEQKAIGEVISTVAQVLPAQGDEVTLTATTAGILTQAHNNLTEGVPVQAGELLCTIDASRTAEGNLTQQQLDAKHNVEQTAERTARAEADYQKSVAERRLLDADRQAAEVQIERAEAEVKRTREELERLEALVSERLVKQADVTAARGAYQAAEAELKAARVAHQRILKEEKVAEASESGARVDVASAQVEQRKAADQQTVLKSNFSGGRQLLRSSMSGFLKTLLVGNGQYVEVGQPIAVVSNIRSLRLLAEVQSRYYESLPFINGANISLKQDGQKRTFSLADLGGRVVSYGRQAEVRSPLLPVYFAIDNVRGLVPGSFVDMFITTESATMRRVIPSGCITEEMGSYYVYVQLTPELFEKRQVTLGISDGLHTEILSGVNVGERVVERGAVQVKMQQAMSGVDPESGHSH